MRPLTISFIPQPLSYLPTRSWASEERNASAVERLRQSESSRNTVVTGLQHEVELLKQQVANQETLLHAERELTSELRHDKETTQKQLELVTLRLSAPKVLFFGAVSLAAVEKRKNKGVTAITKL